MSEELLFDSLDEPIPPLRGSVQPIPFTNNGDTYLYFHDAMAYVPTDFGLSVAVEPILSLINGAFSVKRIVALTENRIGHHDILEFVQLLDRNCLLDSRFFRAVSSKVEEQFEQARVRKPALAGSAYPASREDLQTYLKRLFEERPPSDSAHPKRALYAPHIDPEVGSDVYVRAFSSLRDLSPSRVVILATAHYAGYYADVYEGRPFIGSTKTFELPHGSVHVDHAYLNALGETAGKSGFTLKDRAHRIEHSIELHLLFARYIWAHDFQIVPILVQGFDEVMYVPDGERGRQLHHFAERIRELDDPDTFYLISGDLSHVGRKFGDPVAASTMRSQVETFDSRFLAAAASGDRGGLFDLIRQNQDRYRICGFPPLYTFMTAFEGVEGGEMDYSWWDEAERESAVSFGAIAW